MGPAFSVGQGPGLPNRRRKAPQQARSAPLRKKSAVARAWGTLLRTVVRMNLHRTDLNDDCWLLTGTLRSPEADDLLAVIQRSAQLERRLGRRGAEPRRTAHFGIGYSSLSAYRKPVDCPAMPKEFDRLVGELTLATGSPFNGALVNHYADGSDSVCWHHDMEPNVADADPVIASVSFGAARFFSLKPQPDHTGDRKKLLLGHGDVVLMCGATQRQWLHTVAKTKGDVGERWNLTLRHYQPSAT
jgi:alkylated DNA repair dioxygenase AlkB